MLYTYGQIQNNVYLSILMIIRLYLIVIVAFLKT